MDLLPDEAQQEIIDSTAAFLEAEMPLSRLRAAPALPSSAQWKKLAELGWFGLGLGEDEGGVGFTLVEETLLQREIGRRLGSISIAATALATRVAARGGEAVLRDALISGRTRAAWAEPAVEARLSPELHGRFLVFDGEGAEVLVTATGDGAVLVRAPKGVRSKPCIDESTGLAETVFDGVTPLARVLPEEQIAERTVVSIAAMLSGVSEEARDQAARYATERFQFGKPIGVFQAVKHRCADMAVRCEAAWSQTVYAALALRDGHPDASFHASSAKVVATDAALENSASNVQVHGGYGFTTEFDAHLLVKRTHVLDRIAGSMRAHLAAVLTAPGKE